jgi:hypothetical protein
MKSFSRCLQGSLPFEFEPNGDRYYQRLLFVTPRISCMPGKYDGVQ